MAQNPLSPSFTRSKDEGVANPPPSLTRRRTDFKDGSASGDKPKLDTGADMFSSLKRTTTNPISAGINGPSSPWSAAPASGFSAFGNFSLDGTGGQPTTPGDKKLGFGSVRGESRFKGLMNKGSLEDVGSKSKDLTSSLEKLDESGDDFKQNQDPSLRPTSRDSNLWGDLNRTSGPARGDETSSAAQAFQRIGEGQRVHNQPSFASFGHLSEQPSFSELMHQRDMGLSEALQPQSMQSQEPMSPSNTNPYDSPESERRNAGHEPFEEHQGGFFGGSLHPRPGHTSFPEADRSQNSSAGPSRAFPPLTGLGGLGGLGGNSPWSAAPGGLGTPNRATAGFSGLGDPRFGAGDAQPQSAGGFGNLGTFGRSKMGSLFPPQMQEQMRAGEMSRPEHGMGDNVSSRDPGHMPFGAPSRDTDSPANKGRSILDDLFDNDRNSGVGVSSPFGASEANLPQRAPSQSQVSSQIPFTLATTMAPTSAVEEITTSGSYTGRTPELENSSNASNQLPPAQQRQMVMPDRMRWIYRDPQGNTQGPWSGLEMHDWYKAGFFSPELLVKKVEDNDYEPLAQLIRRIGNSREPFLVPQIGIPHGPTNNPTPSALSLSSPTTQSGSAQPPFAGSFPSFGTTLTADQQNALERRKQEEQYLMARQKEHLVQHQLYLKSVQMQGIAHGINPQQLHHSSSAHSLQSQPSYGSITSPTGYQPSPGQMPIHPPGSMPGIFEGQVRSTFGGPGAPGDPMPPPRDLEMNVAMDRLSLGRSGPGPFPGQHEPQSHQQQVFAAMQDRARLQMEQDQADPMQHEAYGDGPEGLDRLEHFQQLRAQEGDQTIGSVGDMVSRNKHIDHPQDIGISEYAHLLPTSQMEQPGMSQQQPQPITTLGRTISPLPAPAARRHRADVADNLAAGSRSRSATPVDTPTTALAPWAKENAEQSSKGPSLKEIQEAEARKAAQQEELAFAARRAQAEQERATAAQAPASAPGLPSTANWAAASGSPVSATAVNGPSAWAKPLAGKVATPTTGAKKTLAQIQKEEEARKNRAAGAIAAPNASSAAATPTAGPAGKRYADLAGKTPAPGPQIAGGNAWTTVGAGGKAKTPATPTPAPATVRPTGSSAAAVPSVKAKPAPSARAEAGNANVTAAFEEFKNWIRSAIGKGLSTKMPGTSSSPRPFPSSLFLMGKAEC